VKSGWIANELDTDVPEEEIVHFLSRAGEVKNFRLIQDKETGKPKGFGFAEFIDHDSAASAVRNLNDNELGGRRIRVDWSNDGDGGDSGPRDAWQSTGVNGQTASATTTSTALPPLPPGADLEPGLTCPDAISKTLSALPPPQLLDVLSQMKNLAKTDPARATELLSRSPQFAYAMFQALLLLGLVDTSVLSSVIEQTSQQSAPPAPAPVVQQPPYTGYGATFNQPAHVPTPPFQQPQSVAPPPQLPPPPAAAAAAAAGAGGGQADILRQVLQLTQEQIDALAPEHKAQIMALRQQFMNAQFRV
jgi:cleavage stimulation factor subunit 2